MRMTSMLCVLVVLISFAVSGEAMAQKIAYVRLQQALNDVEEGKRAKAAIESELKTKEKKLESLKLELKTMREDLEKQKTVLSKEALEQKATEMQTKFMDLQKQAVAFEQELKTREAESVGKILASLKTVVVEVSKTKGFDLVFENSADTLIYGKEAVDITSDVIKAYNSKK